MTEALSVDSTRMLQRARAFKLWEKHLLGRHLLYLIDRTIRSTPLTPSSLSVLVM